VLAIGERDQETAYRAMYEHLTKVRDNLLKFGSATDL
jgi:DNA-binding FadR family transcriptional regulator